MYYTFIFILPQADLDNMLSNIGGPSYLDDHARQEGVRNVRVYSASIVYLCIFFLFIHHESCSLLSQS